MVLVYPYFDPPGKKSNFRFPPLGLGYIASYMRGNGIEVDLVDCTFLSGEAEAVRIIAEKKPTIIGFYSMFTLEKATLRLGKALHELCDLLVVGGPMPTTDPDAFLDAALERVVFGLVAGDDPVLEAFGDHFGGEVADADGADLALAL